jgi:hypothetical protein
VRWKGAQHDVSAAEERNVTGGGLEAERLEFSRLSQSACSSRPVAAVRSRPAS